MENSLWDVMVVSSSLENRQHVSEMLFRLGIDPICVSSVNQCCEVPRKDLVGLVFCDRKVKDGDYRDILSAVGAGSFGHSPMVVMMSDLASPEEYQQVRRHGLFDVISSPCRPTDVEWMVILAKRYRRRAKELLEPTRNLSLHWKAARAGA
jgi:DNA-binding NtrC family response regulator